MGESWKENGIGLVFIGSVEYIYWSINPSLLIEGGGSRPCWGFYRSKLGHNFSGLLRFFFSLNANSTGLVSSWSAQYNLELGAFSGVFR